MLCYLYSANNDWNIVIMNDEMKGRILPHFSVKYLGFEH